MSAGTSRRLKKETVKNKQRRTDDNAENHIGKQGNGADFGNFFAVARAAVLGN